MRVLLSLALALTGLACGAPEPPSPPEFTGPSVYELRPTLEAHDGRAVSLDVHRGHPTLLTMFYASCPQACPMIIARIQGIEAALSPPERAALRVLMVSIDPEHDDPRALTALAGERGLDTRRWVLARATEPDVRVIAAVLGVKYRRLPDGHYNHASVLTLVDAEGRIAATLDAIGDPADAVITRIRELLASSATGGTRPRERDRQLSTAEP